MQLLVTHAFVVVVVVVKQKVLTLLTKVKRQTNVS